MPIRLLLLVVFAGLLILLAYRTIQNSRDRVEWTRIVSLVVLSVIFGQQAWVEFQWNRQEQVLAQAVYPISGPESEVHCQRFSEAFFYTRNNLGEVQFGENGRPELRATLAWDACRDLRDFLGTDRKNPTNDQFKAIHVLAHEAMHMYGYTNEAVTECYALQLTPWLAQSLGVPGEVTDEKMKWYLETIYPNMPREYKARDCTAGGLLDLDPLVEDWPRATIPIEIPSAD